MRATTIQLSLITGRTVIFAHYGGIRSRPTKSTCLLRAAPREFPICIGFRVIIIPLPRYLWEQKRLLAVWSDDHIDTDSNCVLMCREDMCEVALPYNKRDVKREFHYTTTETPM